jgi:hypothetical protein
MPCVTKGGAILPAKLREYHQSDCKAIVQISPAAASQNIAEENHYCLIRLSAYYQ